MRVTFAGIGGSVRPDTRTVETMDSAEGKPDVVVSQYRTDRTAWKSSLWSG